MNDEVCQDILRAHGEEHLGGTQTYAFASAHTPSTCAAHTPEQPPEVHREKKKDVTTGTQATTLQLTPARRGTTSAEEGRPYKLHPSKSLSRTVSVPADLGGVAVEAQGGSEF